VPPASVPDLLALVGDTADGFPGLPGWGAKSAAAVLDRWGHLEDIPVDPLEWDAGVRGAAKLNATLRASFEQALLFRRIATVETDAEVGTVDDWRWTGPRADFAEVAAALGAPELVARAEKILAGRS
jgi:5'-3' exonuclease